MSATPVVRRHPAAMRDSAPTAPIYRLEADFFRMLGHPVRVQILDLLQAGGQSVGELQSALDLDSSGTSQHLAIMRRAGLVDSRRAGTSVFYSVRDPRVHQLLQVARQVLSSQLEQTQALLGDLAAEPHPPSDREPS